MYNFNYKMFHQEASVETIKMIKVSSGKLRETLEELKFCHFEEYVRTSQIPPITYYGKL